MKEALRQKVLGYSGPDIAACETGILSAGLRKKIKGQVQFKVFGLSFLGVIFISYSLIMILMRESFLESDIPVVLYYALLGSCVLFGILLIPKLI